MFEKPFAVVDSTTIAVRLSDQIQELVLSLVTQLRELLLVDDSEEIKRLYPTAYPDDEKQEEQYRSMVHDQLLMGRLDAIETVESTIAAAAITTEQADQWMTTLNEVRLVLGTKLDVSEEDDGTIDVDDPDATSQAIYYVLTNLLGSLTDARSKQL